MNTNKKHFTTGEFAKICNVNKQTLIYYDKIGLFSPNVKAENGYRYYSIHQYELFSVIDLLKELGMSLKAIHEFIENKSPEYFLSVMQQQKAMISEKLKQLKMMERMVDTQIELAEKAATTDFSRLSIIELIEEKVYYGNIVNHTEEDFVKSISRFIQEISEKKLDTGYPIGIVIRAESLLQNNYNEFSQLYIKQYHDNETDDHIHTISGTFLVGYHIGQDATIHHTYERMMDEIKRQNLTMGDFALIEYVFDSLVKKSDKDYITKILLHVKTKFK